MLEAEIIGIKYHRLLTNGITLESTAVLKHDYDYSFIVSYNNEFIDNDYNVVEKQSCIIDVTQGEDNIIKGFNSTSRNELRRTYKTPGLEFHFGYSNFEKYYLFYKSCELARGWYPVPENELGNCLLFTASFEGEYISGMSCYFGEDVIRVSRIYSNKKINSNPLITGTIYGSAAKRLVFDICNYAINNNFKKVDLGGVDFSDPAKEGISRFKTSLGGEILPVKLARYTNANYEQKKAQVFEMGYDIT
ncbi:MAG: hypothetical protein V4663_07985 [Bacteroidota bacterium]